MQKTIFLFAETALELIPQEIHKNDIIKRYALKNKKNPSQFLLDSSYHYKAMKNLTDFEKRGRPDIIHFCLMNLIESTLVKSNPKLIEIYIHTINDIIINVNTETRLPKNFDRFKGLMVQLFHKKKIVGNNKILINVLENETLQTILKEIPPDRRFILSFHGNQSDLKAIFELNKNNDLAIIIGGFAYGKLSKNIMELTSNVISIYPDVLKAWIVLNKVICLRELTQNSFNEKI
ncbi:MAG: 16S rRNA methyltransferase [Asgard group archaeon]|nr:16S rRNA methyltransferase [Asgard group archaeon]